MRGKIAIAGRIAVITKFGNAESWQSTPLRHCETCECKSWQNKRSAVSLVIHFIFMDCFALPTARTHNNEIIGRFRARFYELRTKNYIDS